MKIALGRRLKKCVIYCILKMLTRKVRPHSWRRSKFSSLSLSGSGTFTSMYPSLWQRRQFLGSRRKSQPLPRYIPPAYCATFALLLLLLSFIQSLARNFLDISSCDKCKHALATLPPCVINVSRIEIKKSEGGDNSLTFLGFHTVYRGKMCVESIILYFFPVCSLVYPGRRKFSLLHNKYYSEIWYTFTL